MTEERALKLFARCYNSGDFSKLIRRLHKRVTFEAYDRFYKYSGAEKVAAILAQRAASLNSMPQRNRAYSGYVQVRYEIIGVRMESCLVLTGSDPRDVHGLVRIKCTPLHIKAINILEPKLHNYTRAEYVNQ